MSALDLVHLARTAATRAGSYLGTVQRPAGPADWTLKGARDFVTEVDRTTERIIVEVLLKGEPGSRVVGEELALDLVDVAAGRFDGFWEQRLSAWDIAAGTLLIREAGGLVTDLRGRDIGIEHTSVVAGNPAIHAWLIETFGSD